MYNKDGSNELENVAITLLCGDDCVRLELHDDNANITFIRLEIDHKEFVQALGRLSHSRVRKASVYGLNLVGKKHLCKRFEVCLGDADKIVFSERNQLALDAFKKECPEGWEFDRYLGSQDSFVYRNDKMYASTIIRKWE